MLAGRMWLALLCAGALLGCLGCRPAESDDTGGEVHYGYTGSRPAVCASCEE